MDASVLAQRGLPRTWVHPTTLRLWALGLVLSGVSALFFTASSLLADGPPWQVGAAVGALLLTVVFGVVVRRLRPEPFCVLCGVSRLQARRLLSGANSCVCDECFALGVSTLTAQPASERLPTGLGILVTTLLQSATPLVARGEPAVRALLEGAFAVADTTLDLRRVATEAIRLSVSDVALRALHSIPEGEIQSTDLLAHSVALADVGQLAEAAAVLQRVQPASELERGVVLNNQAWFELESGGPATPALRARAEEAVRVVRQHGEGVTPAYHRHIIGRCAGTLAHVLLALQEPQGALTLLQQARAEQAEADAKWLVAEGRAHVVLGQQALALPCFQQAEQLSVPWSTFGRAAREALRA